MKKEVSSQHLITDNDVINAVEVILKNQSKASMKRVSISFMTVGINV